ncbi:MAG: hypothetical protein LAO20_16395 [Acidobacteriia bacterium]|nr:hypothetical protein [Terriglobia bacterium]
MHVNINLASQKYEDVRQFFVRWGTALGVAGILTLLLVILAWHNHSKSANLSTQIAGQKREIARLQKEESDAERIENLPANIDVTRQKNFWNSQLMRRQFSWTQLLNDLQKIMPRRAYVSTVHPEITLDRRMKLTLVIEGEKHADAVQLVQKLESSERFSQAHIIDENTQKEQRPGGLPIIRFGIEAFYTPRSGAQAKTPAKEGL